MGTLEMKRRILGLNQAELGKLAGISQQAIARYENGYCSPRPPVAKRLAKVLGCEWWELYEDNEREVKKGGQK